MVIDSSVRVGRFYDAASGGSLQQQQLRDGKRDDEDECRCSSCGALHDEQLVAVKARERLAVLVLTKSATSTNKELPII